MIDNIAFDTVTAAHILNEELPLNLGTQASLHLNADDWGKGLFDFGDKDFPPSDLWGADGMGRYCATDTVYSHMLFELQKQALREDNELSKLMKYLIVPGLNAYTQMELNGIWVNMDKVRSNRLDMQERRDIERASVLLYVPEDFRETADFDNNVFLRKWLFGPKPEGLGLQPVSYTEKTKVPQVDDKTIQALIHPAMDKLREYKKCVKNLQFFDAWEAAVGPDNRLHPSFNLTGTVTGRRSCTNPNLHQVPRDPLLRRCLSVPKGWKFFEVDYSSAEVRLSAWFAEEDTMLTLFKDQKGDVYRSTAAAIYKKPMEEVTKDERQKAKAIVLGFLYGMSSKGFVAYAKQQYGVEFTQEEGAEFRETFFSLYPKFLPWHFRQKKMGRKELLVKSPIGRVRRLTNLLSIDTYEISKAQRQAINSPVQGFGGDMTLASLVSLAPILDSNECMVVGDIHDALLFQVREDVWEKWAKKILKIMEKPPALAPFNINIPVRMKAEGKIGSSWGSGLEFVLEDFKDDSLSDEWWKKEFELPNSSKISYREAYIGEAV